MQPREDATPPPAAEMPPWEETPPPPVAEMPPREDTPPPPMPPEPEETPEKRWSRLLGAMEPRLPIGHYALLCGGVQITGKFSGNELVLFAEPGFAYELFKNPQVLDQFRAAASELCGRTVPVRLEKAVADPDAAAKKREQLMQRKGITIKA